VDFIIVCRFLTDEKCSIASHMGAKSRATQETANEKGAAGA